MRGREWVARELKYETRIYLYDQDALQHVRQRYA